MGAWVAAEGVPIYCESSEALLRIVRSGTADIPRYFEKQLIERNAGTVHNHFYKEYLVVTRIMNNFAVDRLYNYK